jgi:hypothetical protein
MVKFIVVLGSLLLANFAFADNYTKPHVRRDGTYVPGHFSSEPNEYRFDNYSARGNTNPYTGERGTQRHEFTNPPAFNTGRQQQQPTYDPYSTPHSNTYGSQPRRR